MKTLLQFLAVGGGGFIGAVLRYAVAEISGRWFEMRFPIGTFIINITGSFILGWFITYVSDRHPVSDIIRLAVAVGFVGAYTTFSTFTFETTKLMDDGAFLIAMLNIIASLIVGLLAVRFGIIVARRV